jgi:hypothetical protein
LVATILQVPETQVTDAKRTLAPRKEQALTLDIYLLGQTGSAELFKTRLNFAKVTQENDQARIQTLVTLQLTSQFTSEEVLAKGCRQVDQVFQQQIQEFHLIQGLTYGLKIIPKLELNQMHLCLKEIYPQTDLA